jgi:uncharacterized FlaG/YvyC family protein
MISVDNKVYQNMFNFPVGYNTYESEQEKQELIEEYRHLTDEATGKLLELINDDIELIQDKVDYKLAKKHNDHIQNIIDYVEWQYETWSNGLKTKEEGLNEGL